MLLLLLVNTALALTPERAAPIDVAEQEQSASITVARLILRDDSELGAIYSTDGAWRVVALETLRAHGYDARGAENLVFGQDNSHQTKYALGGEVTDGECWGPSYNLSCWVQVDWQLLDTRTQQVVYSQSVQGSWRGPASEDIVGLALQGALEGLLSYEGFHTLMVAERASAWTAYPALTLKRCETPARTLPKELETLSAAVVMLKTERGVGTGYVVSPDGWVVTAAHVVEGASTAQVQTKQGMRFDGEVVRVDSAQDVALVKLPGSGYGCLPLREAPAALGEDLWAVGNPLGEELSFSVTKGLVSGLRELESGSFVQTDAPINPGYSGGPLVDSQGQVLGTISWKVAGTGLEGLSFGVPVAVTQERLGLVFGERSDTEWDKLEVAAPLPEGGEEMRRFRPDREPPAELSSSSSSSYSSGLDLGIGDSVNSEGMGRSLVAVTVIGVALVGGTAAWYYSTDETTSGTWLMMASANTMGWAMAGSGAALLGIRARINQNQEEE